MYYAYAGTPGTLPDDPYDIQVRAQGNEKIIVYTNGSRYGLYDYIRLLAREKLVFWSNGASWCLLEIADMEIGNYVTMSEVKVRGE